MTNILPFRRPPGLLPLPAPPGEVLFDCVRLLDRVVMRCELAFHGDNEVAWEARFSEGGRVCYSRSAFQTRALAVEWATQERNRLETGGTVKLIMPKLQKTPTEGGE